MEYILNPSGLNRSKADVLQIFYDVRGGDDFNETFLNTFDMSLIEFEESIYYNLKQYLE
jgi:hypothetical protein